LVCRSDAATDGEVEERRSPAPQLPDAQVYTPIFGSSQRERAKYAAMTRRKRSHPGIASSLFQE
jgi:hypothetical protein